MSDQPDEEKIEVVLSVRLPMSVRVLGWLSTVTRREYEGEIYMRQTGKFLEFFRVVKGGEA